MSRVRDLRQAALAAGLAALDADVLLGHVLERSRTWLFTWPDAEVTPDDQARFDALVSRRRAGEPVAHLVGEREFWSLPIAVNAATLIPRPDTETLVEAVLDRLDAAPRRVADLGTGTGAIALALASERPAWTVSAIDRVPEAVELARHNAERLGLVVRVIEGQWCEPLADASQHALIANPPYIDPADPHLGEGDVRFEPRSALAAADGGLADLRTLVDQGRRVLAPGGWLFLEHGWQQGEAVRRLLADAGYANIETLEDLGGRERVTLGRWSG